MNALRICRTSPLGGHKEECDSCGAERYSYNSCRNRNCPKCQLTKQAFWVEDVSQRIVDTKYFHIVFTLPEELNEICLLDSKKFYNTLFGSVWKSLRTLGYTHRVAISNSRIINIDEQSVTFRYKDYRDNSRVKPTKLSGVELLRRFSMHILPKGFVKIRYYGILSNRFAKQTAVYRKPSEKVEGETPQKRLHRLTGFDAGACPHCKKGRMHIVEVIPRIRSPVGFLSPKPKILMR